MTKFQNNCVTQVKALLSSMSGVPIVDFKEEHVHDNNFRLEVANLLRRIFRFAEIPYEGKELAETNFVARFRFKNHDFKIFIYDDDASFDRDDVSFLCEQPDYDSETEMIKDFLSHLSEAVLSEHFEGNCETSGKEWFIILAVLVLILATVIGGGVYLFHFFSK